MSSEESRQTKRRIARRLVTADFEKSKPGRCSACGAITGTGSVEVRIPNNGLQPRFWLCEECAEFWALQLLRRAEDIREAHGS
jgi:hypothetical protein